MRKPKLNPAICILISLVLFSACGPSLPDSVTPTPVPTPTCTPIVLPLPEKDYQVRTWVAFERLTLNQIQTVYAKIVKGDQPVAGAKMYTIVHYYTQVDQRWPEVGFETSEENGIASVSFSALDAGSKKDVNVDVYLIYDEAVFHTTTFFTTQC